MKILLHACCGPCSLEPVRILAAEGHDVTLCFSNDNIAPRDEYERRLEALRQFADAENIPLIVPPYDNDAWERTVGPIARRTSARNPYAALLSDASTPLEHEPESVSELLDDENRRERCRACYRLRLEASARIAREGSFDALSTTLAVSPYQFNDEISDELTRAAKKAGVAPYFEDFRPFYQRATYRSRELGMYRQKYCGCRYSIAEGEATRAFIKRQRAQRKAANAEKRAAEEAAHIQRAAEKQRYAQAQAHKRAVLKQLRTEQRRTRTATANNSSESDPTSHENE